MAMIETRYEHIVRDSRGVARIAGTTMKVITLVLEQTAYGWSAEELHFQHPYLTLGQIHSALAYYWDHKNDLDADITQRQARVAQLRQTNTPSPLVDRLKSQD